MLRRTLFLLAALALAGCSKDSTGPNTQTAVSFRVDAQTCKGTGTLSFFIDGAQVGVETLGAGATSKSYQTTRASHTLGARDAGGFTWGPNTVDLTSFSAYTQVLTC